MRVSESEREIVSLLAVDGGGEGEVEAHPAEVGEVIGARVVDPGEEVGGALEAFADGHQVVVGLGRLAQVSHPAATLRSWVRRLVDQVGNARHDHLHNLAAWGSLRRLPCRGGCKHCQENENASHGRRECCRRSLFVCLGIYI